MEMNKDDLLAKRLAKYPELHERMEQILEMVENFQGDANTADEAEERAIEEVRKLGQEMLGVWAKEKEKKLVRGVQRRYRGTMGKAEVEVTWSNKSGEKTLYDKMRV